MKSVSETMDNTSKDQDAAANAAKPALKRPLTSTVMAGLGVLCAVYIFNPTAGFVELIPDNIPIIGNLDEAGAVTLLLGVLAYFGFDLTKIFRLLRHATDKKTADDGVIDID